MSTFYLSTERYVRNPVRVQHWDGSMRAGDDFKLALTVYADDDGTPAVVDASISQILLWPDTRCYPHSCDYGFAWASGGSPIPGPVGGWIRQIAGFTTPVRAGGINFLMSGSNSLCQPGRYRLAIQVDLPDGSFTQIEGILQVRRSWGLPVLLHTAPTFFTLDVSDVDGPSVLAPLVINGIPFDIDGFPLVPVDPAGSEPVPAPPLPPLTVTTLTALLAGLPTTLPATPGVLWMDGGVLAIS